MTNAQLDRKIAKLDHERIWGYAGYIHLSVLLLLLLLELWAVTVVLQAEGIL